LTTNPVRSCFELGRIFAIRTLAIASDHEEGYWNNVLLRYVATSCRISLDATSREYCGDSHWGNVIIAEVEVEVEVNLRPTVSRPVCLGVRRPSGTFDQFFFLI
jgi:hypothetical protein